MKKFDRLDRDTRKEEIKSAAARLFLEKGFHSTTMENIVSQVSLSKGGVYRIYPSSRAILADLILDGMRQRNEFYCQQARKLLSEKNQLTLEDIARMVCDSLLMLPETASLYGELLLEKRRDPELRALYDSICQTSVEETMSLIQQFHVSVPQGFGPAALHTLTDFMNTAILGITVLELREDFSALREAFYPLITNFLLSVREQNDTI